MCWISSNSLTCWRLSILYEHFSRLGRVWTNHWVTLPFQCRPSSSMHSLCTKWACFWSPFWTDVLPSGWDCGFGQSKLLFGSVTLKSARLESKVTEAKLEICGEIVSCVQRSKQYLSALELNKKPERLKFKFAMVFPFYGLHCRLFWSPCLHNVFPSVSLC